MLRARQSGCVLFTEYFAAAEVETVATDALMRADLLPAQAHEPADRAVARSGVRLVNDRATSRLPSL